MSVPIRVAVIGAGPGGLTTLKTLLENSTPAQPIEATLFEAESHVGGTFHYRSYENAELVSSKQLTTFSDHRLPLDSPDHITLPQYVDYLKSYCDKFGLWRYIRLGATVKEIAPLKDEKWSHRVRYSVLGSEQEIGDVVQEASGHGELKWKEEVYDCSHIAMCTGLHVKANVPDIPGIEHLKGDAYHSSFYKSRSQLQRRKVLILGCGETAMDIAYEAIKADAQSVTMCFRTGFLSFPKVLNRFQVFGKTFGGSLPIDGLITNLFETAYVHRAIAKSRLRWFVSDSVIKRVLWFLTGSSCGCNQYVGGLPEDRLGRAYVFLNKSHKAMPYLNRPWKQESPILKLIGNKYLDPPEDVESTSFVDTCTFPQSILETGEVVFTPTKRKDYRRMSTRPPVIPDTLIYCTGYTQSFPWLDGSYPRPSDATCRNIVSFQQPDIAYIGFVRPGVGAIPPIAEQQAMWWTAFLLGKMPLPTSPPHYHLLAPTTARIQYGVDHSAYMSTLAKDFGGAPDLRALWREYGLRVLLAYCFGASFVTFYRLLGPFKWSGAGKVTETELMETVKRRGFFGNLFFGAIPMMFYGMINGVALMLELLGLIPQEAKLE